MTISKSTLITAGLLSGLFLAGSIIPAHAGDGCTRDKGKEGKGQPTSLSTPAQVSTTALNVRD